MLQNYIATFLIVKSLGENNSKKAKGRLIPPVILTHTMIKLSVNSIVESQWSSKLIAAPTTG